MIALAVWLLAAGVVAYAAVLAFYLAAFAVVGIVVGALWIVLAPLAAIREHADAAERHRRATLTPLERRQAAFARMFAEPPCTEQRAPIHFRPDARHS